MALGSADTAGSARSVAPADSPPPRSDEVAVLLRRFGARHGALVRVLIIGPLCGIAVVQAGAEKLVATAVIAAVLLCWSLFYAWRLRRASGGWLLAVDAVILMFAGMSTWWTDAVAEENFDWLRLLVTFAAVAYQWYTTTLVGAVAAVVASGGLVVVLASAGSPVLISAAAWILVSTVLSRVGWRLVQRSARVADRAVDTIELVRREAAIAAAVRADEKELAVALHDTAASTLLMVGGGHVRRDAGWLDAQLRRDLDLLRSYGEWSPGRDDLVPALEAEIGTSRVPVDFDGPATLPLPAGAGRALVEATREAFNNVARHAAAKRIVLRLSADERLVCLEVIDDGRGFAVADVPATKRGLRESIHGRLHRIGGVAHVTSTPDVGTTVRLEWPRA